MWILELLLSGSGSGLINNWIQSYLEKHPKTGYIKAFFIGFGCVAIPFELYILVASRKGLLDDLFIGGAISSSIGLAFGIFAVIFLKSTKDSLSQKIKNQLSSPSACKLDTTTPLQPHLNTNPYLSTTLTSHIKMISQ